MNVQEKIQEFSSMFNDFTWQKDNAPEYTIITWIEWLHTQWQQGMITLEDYRALINIDIVQKQEQNHDHARIPRNC